MFDSFEPFPNPTPDQIRKPPAPVDLSRLSAAQRRRWARAIDAQRQADVRAAKREAGLPDQRLVDRIIVQSLRAAMQRPRTQTAPDGRPEHAMAPTVRPRDIIRRAHSCLVARGYSPEISQAVLIERVGRNDS